MTCKITARQFFLTLPLAVPLMVCAYFLVELARVVSGQKVIYPAWAPPTVRRRIYHNLVPHGEAIAETHVDLVDGIFHVTHLPRQIDRKRVN